MNKTTNFQSSRLGPRFPRYREDAGRPDLLVQREAHDEVEGDADGRRDEHDGRVDVVLAAGEPLDGQVDEDARHHPDEQHRDERAQHLSAVPAEAEPLGRRPVGHPHAEQRDHERRKVRQQVRRVRRYRQTPRQVAACVSPPNGKRKRALSSAGWLAKQPLTNQRKENDLFHAPRNWSPS